ncbi:MAG: 50S ribosomal protein L23 [Patescibacteria group bacterium]
MSWYHQDKNKNKANQEAVKVDKPVANTDVLSINSEPKLKVLITHLIKHPIVSEKAMRLQTYGQYTFKVVPGTSKIELKKEVENMYKVHVIKVTSVKLPKKIVVNKGKHGQRSIRQYMRVRLKSGEVINLGQV